MKQIFASAFAALALMATSVAHADVVIIVNPAAPALTQDQIADIYLGRSNALTPLDQPESVPLRTDFYKKATGRDAAQIKATWSRLVFTGKGQAPKELPDSAAVKKAVAADPKVIGYIDKTALDASVKAALTLN
jgi:ABC-type phosphate transport system substrate-binding protein